MFFLAEVSWGFVVFAVLLGIGLAALIVTGRRRPKSPDKGSTELPQGPVKNRFEKRVQDTTQSRRRQQDDDEEDIIDAAAGVAGVVLAEAVGSFDEPAPEVQPPETPTPATTDPEPTERKLPAEDIRPSSYDYGSDSSDSGSSDSSSSDSSSD